MPSFVYCILQAVSCSLSVMGFGESILGLTGLDNPWIAKGVAIGLVVLLLGKKYICSLDYRTNSMYWDR